MYLINISLKRNTNIRISEVEENVDRNKIDFCCA